MNTSKLLAVDNLEVGYTANILVLAGISFEVRHGEIVGVIGRNGSGKTTLLRGLFGLIPHRRGSVRIQGAEIIRRDPSWIARQTCIGLLPQRERVFVDLSIYENLEIAGWNLSTQIREQRIEECLGMDAFSLFRNRLSERAQLLSGGETLLLALACLFMLEPQLVLLDEPSSGSDPKNRDAILGILQGWKESGKGILLIEQDLRTQFSIADRILLLQRNDFKDARHYGASTLVELSQSSTDAIRGIYRASPVLGPDEINQIDQMVWHPPEG